MELPTPAIFLGLHRDHAIADVLTPVTGTLVGVRLQPASLASLDAWRKKQPDLASRPEAIRRLREVALKTSK